MNALARDSNLSKNQTAPSVTAISKILLKSATPIHRLGFFARNLTLAMIGITSIGIAVAAHAQDTISVTHAPHAAGSRELLDVAAPEDLRNSGSAAAALSELLEKWNRAGFSAPSKPGQSRVYGRDGCVTTGADYNAMVSLIRSAVNDVRERRHYEAMTNIAQANRLLGPNQPFMLAQGR